MSALVILECNVCTAISPPYASAEKAREAEAPDGWTVAIDGEDLDYCPKCTAPAGAASDVPTSLPPTLVEHRAKLRLATKAIAGLRDLLGVIAESGQRVPFETVLSTVHLGARYADETLRELEK